MIRRAIGVCSVLGLCAATALIVNSAYAVQEPAASAAKLAEMDKPVQDFKLKDLMYEAKAAEKDKKETKEVVALSEFKDKKPVVLFFMSEKCSATWQYEKRVGEMLQKYGKDVAFATVRCSANDTPEGIRKFAEVKNFDVPLLNDENGELTKFFKVRNTPNFVVLDKKGVLRYKGGFDDSVNPEKVQNKYLADAITAVLEGKEVKVKETRALG
jgi:peroxiredoxin